MHARDLALNEIQYNVQNAQYEETPRCIHTVQMTCEAVQSTRLTTEPSCDTVQVSPGVTQCTDRCPPQPSNNHRHFDCRCRPRMYTHDSSGRARPQPASSSLHRSNPAPPDMLGNCGVSVRMSVRARRRLKWNVHGFLKHASLCSAPSAAPRLLRRWHSAQTSGGYAQSAGAM